MSRDNIGKIQNGYYIVNLDRQTGDGTHWCAFVVTPSVRLYFDSFGFQAPEQLHEKLGKYSYNCKKIQSLNSDSCGWFCIAMLHYVQHHGNNLKAFADFINLFTNKVDTNEHIIQAYIEHLNAQI